eukprot:gene32000-42699_t
MTGIGRISRSSAGAMRGERSMRVWLLSLAMMSVPFTSPVVAAPGNRCAALRPVMTATQRAADAALVTRLGKQKVTAAQV